jgi:type I restriction enzyme M protein
MSPERLARLGSESSLTKNGLNLDELEAALLAIGVGKVFKNRSEFFLALDATLKKANINLSAAQYKAVWQALSERDETADVCVGAKGKPEPDPDLRGTENVPLDEDLQTYFEREVKPFAPDAWIADDKTKIGCEVPFTRYFYKYQPPRALSDIDKDLATITASIVKMLNEVIR